MARGQSGRSAATPVCPKRILNCTYVITLGDVLGYSAAARSGVAASRIARLTKISTTKFTARATMRMLRSWTCAGNHGSVWKFAPVRAIVFTINPEVGRFRFLDRIDLFLEASSLLLRGCPPSSS
jgi:hypothetical protein